ncbi:TonB-dependent receptor [Coralloluteibacterium thermophilus]|uniref:Carboxypeptidase regulatory-like domain-containing protein n=1 Tax=Coralloluteibacterium thermophilum TaxID=2707049 RepID=A0ABV9NHP3_9GAMM
MMNRSQVRLSRLSICLLAALATAPAMAQQTSAGVGGVITDTAGAPVSGAQVTILHTPSGTVSNTTTDASGRYSARGLRVGGPYTITITGNGRTEVRENVYLTLGDVSNVSARIGATTLEAVQVVGTAMNVDTFSPDRMGAGTTVTLEQIEGLPTIQRNIQDHMRLDPRIAQSDKGRGEITVAGQNPRFNAIRVDGVNTSDTFGLESNNFPTIRQPVSLDAIESIRVDVANYDTTITGATGAVVDAVTKSGTNEFGGSAYYVYRDNSWVRDNEDGTDFAGFQDEETYGATFGGPLIKDRLFFFTNYEKFTRTSPGSSYGPIGSGASNIVDVSAADIAEAQQIARDVYGIDIGDLSIPSSLKQEVEEYAAKIDWNITDDHRASLRISRVEQTDPVIAGFGNNSLGLSSRWYNIDKTVDQQVLQLFSDWSPNFSTEMKVGRRTYDSISNVNARLPQVAINVTPDSVDADRFQSSRPTIGFGTDQFRHGNQIETETLDVFFAGNLYVGDHTLKFGFDWTSNDIYNMYAQNIWGSYEFASLDHFRNGQYWNYRLNAPVPGFDLDSVAMRYKHRNTGLFLQDTWAVNYNLSLMFGLRVDIPDLDDVPMHNQLVQQIYGYDNRQTLDSNFWQPRFGFNYTFDSDRPTQLRGGLGLFQGAAANVWVGNSYQNSGFGLIGYDALLNTDMTQAEREAIWASLPFNPDPDNPTTPPAAAGYAMMVNLMEPGIKQPSVWKANLAFDHELPWAGIVASAELIHMRNKDGLMFERLDLGAPTAIGQDGRPIYWGNPATAGGGFRANQNAELAALRAAGQLPPGYENVTGWHNDGVILMKNTDKGDSTSLTVSLSKPLTDTWGWSLGYTHTEATEVSPLTSSRAISNWNSRAVVDPNEDVAATANYEIRDRFIGTLSWQKAFFGDYRTSVTVLYEGRAGRPYSWRFLNDMNGDGYVNDLLYVPAGRGDVLFTGGAEMENAFFEWLNQHPDLARYAGGPAERNGSRNSWVNTFDIRVSQEFPGFFAGHKSELVLDIMNVGNLINKDWGRVEEQSPFSDLRAVNFRGVDEATGKYIYDFNESQVWTPRLYDDNGLSRWSAQLTFRYRF